MERTSGFARTDILRSIVSIDREGNGSSHVLYNLRKSGSTSGEVGEEVRRGGAEEEVRLEMECGERDGRRPGSRRAKAGISPVSSPTSVVCRKSRSTRGGGGQ
ncbi:unnamed protein product [Calypogeia fissa]